MFLHTTSYNKQLLLNEITDFSIFSSANLLCAKFNCVPINAFIFKVDPFRGVNLVGNWGGGRWQTAFGSKLLTRKTGRVETSDTVEDRNKNVYLITGQLKLKHYAPYLGGHDVLPPPPCSRFWRNVSPCPPRDLRPWIRYRCLFLSMCTMYIHAHIQHFHVKLLYRIVYRIHVFRELHSWKTDTTKRIFRMCRPTDNNVDQQT